MRGKNPLSPFLYTLNLNDSYFPKLSDYAGFVNLNSGREELLMKSLKVQVGDVTGSNGDFDVMRKAALSVLTAWHFAADPRIKLSKTLLSDELHVELETMDIEVGIPDDARCLLISKVAEYAAVNFDPARISKKKVMRKGLSSECEGVKTLAGRQSVGAKHSSIMRSSDVLERLNAAWLQAVETDVDAEVTKEMIQKISGVSRAVVYKRWSEIDKGV